jgi:hypothetical protein
MLLSLTPEARIPTLKSNAPGSELRAGDWVTVRTKEEILRTLDRDGQLDGMPFMPEMFAFCGKRFQVQKRAHKTCDTVFPTRSRRVDRTVHLETRCDGQAHGGCQASCLLFWKEAWLIRADAPPTVEQPATGATAPTTVPAAAAFFCSEADVVARACVTDPAGMQPTYMCQATRLPYATSDLKWWDVRQYVEDYSSGNVSLWRLFKGLVYSAYYNLSQAGIGLGRPMRWFYDNFHWAWRGPQYPRHHGSIPRGKPTPKAALNLKPGEIVRVKPYKEILQTLDEANLNRGMLWDAEMVPYCESEQKVLRQVTRLIDEKTGKMLEMKTPAVILDSVVCQSGYSTCRMFCPRAIYPYWREVWLDRA